ncbi:MAG TPA: hypothetical protein VMF06_08560 [Candidatus Limnocylindria bacterium]|nr:hypothetical protein [Candidatus Limnocylindria bacterium]
MELATGLNYWDGASWTPSDPSFTEESEGFAAMHIQHPVFLKGNLNQKGAVSLRTPDGIHLKSTPVALGLYDAASGQSLLLAKLQDCSGMLVSSNKIIFPDAFVHEGIRADVVYTTSLASFDQDVVLRTPIVPEDYGFPSNTTRIQIFTEFYGEPTPEKIRRPLRIQNSEEIRRQLKEPDLVDEVLGFGQFALYTGNASYIAGQANDSEKAVPVAKEFIRVEGGRSFLIESVEYPAVSDKLARLPRDKAGAGGTERRSPTSNIKSLLAALPPPNGTPMKILAAMDRSQRRVDGLGLSPGLIIDYSGTIGGTISSSTSLQGDTTYIVVNPAVYNGSLSIEGGAVLKFPASTANNSDDVSPFTTYIRINAGFSVKATAYRPVLFTAIDDDTVGDSAGYIDVSPAPNRYSGALFSIPTNGGSPVQKYYANPALSFGYTATSFSNVRFAYCQEAIRFTGASTETVTDSQLVHCLRGLTITGSGSISGSISGPNWAFNNVLFGSIPAPINLSWNGSGATLGLTHCTFDHATTLATGSLSSAACYFTNCVISSCSALSSGTVSIAGSYNGFYQNGTGTSSFGSTVTTETVAPFEAQTYSGSGEPNPSTAEGWYYLRPNSQFVDAGTTNIPATVLSTIKRKTTHSPLFLSKNIVADTSLTPLCPRDEGKPNLGYHYAPIDYICNGATVNNSTLRIADGTVLAFSLPLEPDGIHNYLPFWGIRLNNGARLMVEGTPTNRVTFASLDAVQENPILEWNTDTLPFITVWGWYFQGNLVQPLPEIDLNFSDFPSLAGERLAIGFWGGPGLTPPTFDLVGNIRIRNCSFQGGLFLYNSAGPVSRTVAIENCIFERCRIAMLQFCYHQPVTPEQSFRVSNCLFYYSSLNLAPTGGADWIFSDNILDHSGFVQGSSPIPNSHHNAYVGMNNYLGPGLGTGDQILGSLAYASGTLGNYYLPASSPQLLNRGSRFASDAGLFHYTSFASNLKEGGEVVNESDAFSKTVNIGPHYLSMSAGGKPVDSDSDGIADYIEDANGDGVSQTTESSWNTANSGPLEIVYPVAGTQVQGIMSIRVRLGATATSIKSLIPYVDGKPAFRAISRSNPSQSSTEIQIDTRRLSQGAHAFAVRAALPDALSGQYTFEASSPSMLLVDNDYRYPNQQTLFGSKANARLEVDASSGKYQITWLPPDQPTCTWPPGSGTFDLVSTGDIAAGIDTSLNMLDFDNRFGGGLYASREMYALLQVGSDLASLGTPSLVPVVPRDKAFPSTGRWVVSYDANCGDTELFANPIADPLVPDGNGSYRRALHYFVFDSWVHNGPLSGAPTYATTSQDNPTGKGGQTYPKRDPLLDSEKAALDEKLLLSYLGLDDSRNYYGRGHGFSTRFANIQCEPFKDGIDSKRFRFVFIDGCNTFSSDFLGAFGMQSFEFGSDIALSTYNAKGGRPGAYLTWSSQVPLCYFLLTPETDPTTGASCIIKAHSSIANWHNNVLANWIVNQFSLSHSIDLANDTFKIPMLAGEVIRDRAKNVLSDISKIQVLTDHSDGTSSMDGFDPHLQMKLSGYGQLHFNEYNHGSDWP